MIKSKRKKPRPGRLDKKGIDALRAECYLRDGGICQHCGKLTMPHADHIHPDSYHMAHIKAKRIGLDPLSNVKVLCGSCHRISHLWGPSMQKPVPAK